MGGSKIEAVALDRSGGEHLRRRIRAPQGNHDATVRAIAALAAGLDADLPERASVGIGIPGATSQATGLVNNANSTWLIGHSLNRDLGHAIGRPVRLANDANCFALSEAIDGAATGEAVVFGVIVGTGTGGGGVVGGEILTGPNAIAGEWGHNLLPWPRTEASDAGPLEWPGPACYCGKSGCIETCLSGPGLTRDLQLHTGEKFEPAAIAAAAAGGDECRSGASPL